MSGACVEAPPAVIRRPLTKTRVRLVPKPRRSTDAVPVEPFEMLAFWLVSIEGKLLSTCSMFTKPRFLMFSAVTTVTGLVAPKPSCVAIRLPVTRTSSTFNSASSCAKTNPLVRVELSAAETAKPRCRLLSDFISKPHCVFVLDLVAFPSKE